MKSEHDSRRVLIVEDERALSVAFAATVEQCGGRPMTAPSLAQARDALRAGPVAALVLDIGLPDGNGLALLESIPEGKRPPCIVVTAHGEIENAIAARKLGVSEFFDKPVDFEAFKAALVELLEQSGAEEESGRSPSTFIGAASSMREVFQKVAHACASREPVLITGETGTGKSTVANLIAQHTGRLPESKGVFRYLPSGNRKGESDREMGEGEHDVVLIDSVSLMSPQSQAEFVASWERAGAEFPRVIATADSSFRDQVERGEFRSDLYYRLQVLEIRLPPLRERLDDIPALASFFLGELEPSQPVRIEEATLRVLASHDWPGNLRELRNIISYANTIRSGGTALETWHLPDHLPADSSAGSEAPALELRGTINQWLGETEFLPSYREISADLERILLECLLERFDHKLARLAGALNANRTTLRRKLRKGDPGGKAR